MRGGKSYKQVAVKNIYLFNFLMVALVLLSILLMFYVQFKVGNLQSKVSQIDNQIAFYDDEIRVLEVEWVYLTRPERLRILSEKYLKNNDYIVSSQVKDLKVLEKYYLSKLEASSVKEVAVNSKF